MWKVKIQNGFFMCGVHTFNTKKLALDFIDAWIRANDHLKNAINFIELVK